MIVNLNGLHSMLTCNRTPAGVGVDILDWPVELRPSRGGAVGGAGDPK